MKLNIDVEDLKKNIANRKLHPVNYMDFDCGPYKIKNVPWIKQIHSDEPCVSGKTFNRIHELVYELHDSGNVFEVEYSDKN